MIEDMTTRRISLTLPEGLVAAAERAVAAGHARSVSAYIADAVETGTARAFFAEPAVRQSRQIDVWLAGVMRGQRHRGTRSSV
jgi:Arc/MetJ-type ribon-helix-helix transcriptional regulator